MNSAVWKLILFSLAWPFAPVTSFSAEMPADAKGGVDAHPANLLLVNGEDGARFWQPSQKSLSRVPRYPTGLGGDNEQGCIAMGFKIQPDGVPVDFQVLQFAANKPTREVQRKFAASATQALGHWRYEPGPENPKRLPGYVAHVTSFHFNSGVAAGSADWSAVCKIDDLGAFLRARGKPEGQGER